MREWFVGFALVQWLSPGSGLCVELDDVIAFTPPAGSRVEAVKFSPDQHLLAFAVGNVISVWNLDRGQQQWRLDTMGLIRDLALSGDNRFLAVGGSSASVSYLSSDDGAVLWTKPTRYAIESLAFSRDNDLLAIGLQDGHVTVLRTGDGQQVTSFKPHRFGATALAFLQDGRLLSGGVDQFAWITDLANGTSSRPLDAHLRGARAHVGVLTSVAVDPTGRLAATGAYWNGAANTRPRRRDGTHSSHDATLRLWDTVTAEMTGELRLPWGVTRVLFLQPGNRLLLSTMPDFVPFGDVVLATLPDLTTQTVYKSSISGEAHRPGITAMAASSEGSWAAFGTAAGNVQLWDLRAFRRVLELAISAGGTLIVAGDGRYAVSDQGPQPQVKAQFKEVSQAVLRRAECIVPELLERPCQR